MGSTDARQPRADERRTTEKASSAAEVPPRMTEQSTAAHVASIREQGYTVLERAIDAQAVATIRDALLRGCQRLTGGIQLGFSHGAEHLC